MDQEERVRSHVDICKKCRGEVDLTRHIGDISRQSSAHDVPDVTSEVIRRRRAGERVILATGEAPSGSWRTLNVAAAVALLLVGGTAVLLILAPTAGASRGELVVEPAAPRAGTLIKFTYSPAFYLADQDSLRLRARARKADSPFPRGGLIGELRTATLHQTAEGRFTGKVQLEPDDVFLAAAVEDFDARNVDTNFGKLWDILVVADNGEPTIAALESRYRVLEPFNWIMASDWAREVAERWPENPFGWAMQYWHDSQVQPPQKQDSIRGFHANKLTRLIANARKEDSEALATLVLYAGFLAQDCLQSALLDQLSVLDSGDVQVVNRQVSIAIELSGGDQRQLLERLEALWQTVDRASEFLVLFALQTAVAEQDDDVARKWIERASDVPQIAPAQLRRVIRGSPSLAPERIALLTTELDLVERGSDALRPLRVTRPEFEVVRQEERSRLAIALATAFGELGDPASASQHLANVTDQLWQPDAIRALTDFYLASGDSLAALEWIGLILANPIYDDDQEAYSSVLAGQVPDTASYLAASRRALTARIVRSVMPLARVSAGTEVSIKGDLVAAGDVFTGRPIVLLLTDQVMAEASMTETLRLDSERLSSRTGIDLFNVIAGPTDMNPTLLDDSWTRIILDPQYDLIQDLRIFGAPVFAVLDAQRNVVASTRHARMAFLIAHALKDHN